MRSFSLQKYKMVYHKFFEVLSDEMDAIVKSYKSKTTIHQLPDLDPSNQLFPSDNFDKVSYDHHMNKKSFTIPGNRGRVLIKLCNKPCDIYNGRYLQNNGYFVLINYSAHDFFVDRYTVLATLISQYSYLNGTFYLYDPDSCYMC
jgi:hypothetical protein